MKTKIIIQLIAIPAFLVLAFACKDKFLDVAPTGAFTSDQLNTVKALDGELVSVYGQLNGRGLRMASSTNWLWGSIRGGDANKGTDPGDYSDINPIQRFENQTTQGVIEDKWKGLYEGVARANSVLKYLPQVKAVTVADLAGVKRIGAEAKFLRAHYYFELKRGFNNTPYVDETKDVSNGIEKVSNSADLWPFIEKDMQYAYDNLDSIPPAVGRVNKWAAACYLAKIYMYEKKYTQAKALFDLIMLKGITSGGVKYALVPKYADVFKAANDNNSESIFAIQASANTGSVNNANPEFDLNFPYNTGPNGPGNCCGFFQPSFELGNSFRTNVLGLPLLDGSYNVAGNEVKTDMGVPSGPDWSSTETYKTDKQVNVFISPNINRSYKSLVDNNKGNNPATSPASWVQTWESDLGNLDPRIDHSIGRRGIPYLDWINHPGNDWIRNQGNGGPYSPKKFTYYKSDVGSNQDNSSWTPGYSAVNYNIIRFADVLLMAAEAEIEVGTLAQAQIYINLIRTRASNPDGFVIRSKNPAANYVINTYTAPFGSKTEAINAVRFERKLELSGEGHRFFDLVRWGVADGVINSYLSYEGAKLPCVAGATFKPGKNEFLPIPQSQIDIQGKDVLIQNPGF